MPKINKNKLYNKKDKIMKKIFDRLYNKNKYMFGFKKELLTQESSTPKFNSFLNKTKSQKNISYNITKIFSSNQDINIKEKDNIKKIQNDNVSTINNNDTEVNSINNTDRVVLNNKNETNIKENNKKNIIVVIRKIK